MSLRFVVSISVSASLQDYYWAERYRRGVESAKRIVCINDGAIWIWMMVFVYFSRRKVLSYISRNCYF